MVEETSNISGTVIMLQPIIHIIIGFILGIFSTPLANWVFSKDNEYCAFPEPYNFGKSQWDIQKVRNEIIVKKYFGKTTSINCSHYKSNDFKVKEYKDKKYHYCIYGKPFDPEIEAGGKCPFA